MTTLRLAIVFFAACSLVACSKPKPGASCTATPPVASSYSGICDGKQAAIVCLGGRYESIKCKKSAVGCMEVMGSVSCDIVEDVGEPCQREFGCSSDHKKFLHCEGGKWALKMACKSSLGCVENVQGVRCTSGEAAAGDPCEANQKDQGSCSADHSQLLVCDGSKFFVANTCRGQNKCRALGNKIDCDDSLAEIGDPCEEPDSLSCDVAKKHLLKCTEGKFAVHESCKKRCNNAFNKFSCD
ncbi:MAG: hypothetical protein JNK82_40990 [Myxococcaceae bacterium]|nr:hypothetical protein [Myxococcaceae bacterium]